MIELVGKARAGNREAFGKLVAEYQTRIFRVAYGIVGRREDAEDVAQEAFVKAYKSIHDLNNNATFYSWLVRITVNTGINYKKSIETKQAVPIEAISEPVDQGETPESAVERQEGQERIAVLLSELPPEHKAVLVLREIEGLPYDKIAAMLNIPLGTVKSRINHARDKLRRLVTKKGVIR